MGAIWYCPLCQEEGTEPDAVYCRNDGARVRPVDTRGSDWIGKVLAGKYEVTRYIDAGGTAEVYEAERVGTGKKVAVKLLHAALAAKQDMLDNFLQEAQLVSRIAHPNIVAIHDFGTLAADAGASPIHYMVMELLDGASLADELARGPLPVLAALKYAMQACEGLAAAHARDVIHCDIKPANIFLQRAGDDGERTVKILDLGIGRLFAQGRPVGNDQPGIVAGTPEYMSPEQAQGRELGPASDVYSMGVAIYEMLLGEMPFNGATYLQVLRMHVHDPPPWPAHVAEARRLPPGTRDVLWRALAKDPKARQGSMLELQRELAALARHEKARASARELGRAHTMPAPAMQPVRSPSKPEISPDVRNPKSGRVAVREETFTAEEDGSGRWRSPPIVRRSSKRPLRRAVTLSKATGADSEVIEIAQDVYWVGRRHGRALECNAYLRVFKRGATEASVLVDPGQQKDLDVVCEKVGAVLGTSKRLDWVFLNHQDPDVAHNAAAIQQASPRAQIVCSEETFRLAQLYGLDPKRFIAVESFRRQRAQLATGHELLFVPTPFCHFRGAVMLYDPASRVLFSGDLFGGARSSDLVVTDRSMAGVEIFHQLYMPSRRALAMAVARVRRLDPQPLVIAPQHGALVTGAAVPKLLDAIEKMDVGVDLLEAAPSPRFVDAANALLQELAESTGEERARAILTTFGDDTSSSSLVVLGDEGQIAGFKVSARLALDALAADALAALPVELRGDLQRSIRAICKEYGIELGSVPAAPKRDSR